MTKRTLVTAIAVVAALFFIGPGLWAFFDAKGFYDNLATFEPYNEHFIHDIGAFQIGIGAALAAALWKRTDAVFAALAGGAIGSGFHTIAHAMDHDLGGEDTDVFVFGVATLVMAAGALLSFREPRH